MKYIILCSVLLVGGCASNCHTACLAGFGPGNTAFDTIGNFHNSQDPCQFYGKPEGYQLADFCFANRNNKNILVIRDKYGRTIGTIK